MAKTQISQQDFNSFLLAMTRGRRDIPIAYRLLGFYITADGYGLRDAVLTTSNKQFAMQLNWEITMDFVNCSLDKPLLIHSHSSMQGAKFLFQDIEFNDIEIQMPIKSLTIINSLITKLTIKPKIGRLTINNTLLESLRCESCEIFEISTSRISKELTLFGTYKKIRLKISKIETISIELDKVESISIDWVKTENISKFSTPLTSLQISHSILSRINTRNLSPCDGELKILSSKLKLLTIDFNKDSFKSDITDSVIDEILLTGKISPGRECILRAVSTQFLGIEYLNNEGALTFLDVTMLQGTVVKIFNSRLGKTEFHNVNFSLSKFIFKHSLITDVQMTNTEFPKRLEHFQGNKHLDEKNMFGQLQTVFQKNGDSVKAYEYLSRETAAFYRHLKVNIFSATWLNLFLNRVSNNFGRSWSRGLLFTAIVSIFFYFFVVINTNKFSFSGRWDSGFIEAFFRFINPLRHVDTDDIFKIKNEYFASVNTFGHIIDFFGRIFIAYGYYQTIQAFRRFGRR